MLVTAGNTLTLIDQVRGITNIFTGRTGAGIALGARERGHDVTLLTSHPETVRELAGAEVPTTDGWRVHAYRTFEDLQRHMEEAVRGGRPEAVIHCAAVSDFRAAGVFAPGANTRFRADDATWHSTDGTPPALVDSRRGKVKSDHAELWLRLVPTPKLIDLIRPAWGFRGILVKFKLEVGVTEEQLREIAERSRRHSGADLMVANTLEGTASWAILGPLEGRYERMGRSELSDRLLDAVEQLARGAGHG